MRVKLFLFALLASGSLFAQEKPNDPYFEQFQPLPAPKAEGLFLKAGDRLAICGDSITEQKMYSRAIETYLTVCTPELDISVRQYGWGGETAEGFFRRMTNDTLRFKPTIATTCYGMNDHKYRPYDEPNAQWYRDNQTKIVEAFKTAGTRVVLGSSGCVGSRPFWSADPTVTKDALNMSLCKFRNIDIGIAEKEQVRFADVFWPMLVADFESTKQYGTNYHIAGKDGVHPAWAGHIVMAASFLRAFGLDGQIGEFIVDLKSNDANVSKGHELVSFKDGEVKIKSSRYPFCGTGDRAKDDTVRSGMRFSKMNKDLNRLVLIVKNGQSAKYKITWGENTKSYTAEDLGRGVNLADEFPANPFSAQFDKVDAAVADKQNYETRQIKDLFHGREGAADKDMTANLTEKARKPLVKAIHTAFVPVTHTIKIEAE
ncbi:MAG: hypothetical protein JWM68_575 [Verrucomicrobiales bacterium]|nr:hypothetical protein [Verrucomicrobiales bacterium]